MTKYLLIVAALVLVMSLVAFIFKCETKADPINGLIAAKFEQEPFDRALQYRYYVPIIESGKKYPLVIYLHGGGERGTDNKSQLNQASLIWVSKEVQGTHPSFVIIPQCPPNHKWVNTKENGPPYLFFNQDEIPESDEMKMIVLLIKKAMREYPIDSNRVYISGFSMGGSGTWDIITRYPNLFAAAIAISGANDTTKASKIVHLPIRMFHGAKDEICPPIMSERMYSILHQLGSKCELMIFPDCSHVCTDQVYKTQGLFNWLFAQDKSIR